MSSATASSAAAVGFCVGLLGVWADRVLRPVRRRGADLRVLRASSGVATLFGTWEGGLIGIGNENRKLAKFHDDIAAGKFLILIYALKEQEAAVTRMMRERHPEAELAASTGTSSTRSVRSKRGRRRFDPDDRLLQKE